jgi:hypothetical protein
VIDEREEGVDIARGELVEAELDRPAKQRAAIRRRDNGT